MVILSIESDSGIVNVKKDIVKWYYIFMERHGIGYEEK